MLSNELVLTVDETNDGITTANVNHTYRRLSDSAFKSEYIHSNHAVDLRDILTFNATPAKPQGNFRGVRRASFKFTKDITVAGADSTTTLTAPIILEVKVSIPTGATAAQLLIERQKAVTLLDDDAVVGPLFEVLET